MRLLPKWVFWCTSECWREHKMPMYENVQHFVVKHVFLCDIEYELLTLMNSRRKWKWQPFNEIKIKTLFVCDADANGNWRAEQLWKLSFLFTIMRLAVLIYIAFIHLIFHTIQGNRWELVFLRFLLFCPFFRMKRNADVVNTSFIFVHSG